MEEAGGEEKREGKKKKKKRSKKTTAAIEEDEQGGGKEDEGPSLIDIGSKETSPMPAAALAAKTESLRKKSPARDVKKGERTYHTAGNFWGVHFSSIGNIYWTPRIQYSMASVSTPAGVYII